MQPHTGALPLREIMSDKTSNLFAVEWSEDIVDWVIQAADQDEIEPEVATYASLAAAIVLARSIDMDDATIREQFETILTKEFPEEMIGEGKG